MSKNNPFLSLTQIITNLKDMELAKIQFKDCGGKVSVWLKRPIKKSLVPTKNMKVLF